MQRSREVEDMVARHTTFLLAMEAELVVRL